MLFVLLFAAPIIEITIFIQVGGLIGLWPAIAEIFITGAIGVTLLRSQGRDVVYRVQGVAQRGEVPLAQVLGGLCPLFAGALLLIPGFVTDGVGFLLLLPPLRSLLGRSIFSLIVRHTRIHVLGGAGARLGGGPYGGGGAVINGDFEDVTPDKNCATKNPGGVERRIE